MQVAATTLQRPAYYPPVPEPPCSLATGRLPLRDKLKQLQKYIEAFEYNHTGKCYYSTKKFRGFAHVANVAQDIMREALPIQCVEATFLGAYLTCDLRDVERYPLSFKSALEGHEHRHIVLAVTSGGKWGALGISRRDCLAYKELKYSSLGALVAEFAAAYTSCWHQLQAIYLGLPLPRNPSCNAPIRWKVRSKLERAPQV
ncbi:Vasohibin-domain-containing protein [Tribonema minus]|uniref:Vasohibin-domain-containing protein n=1 Tax=Tribonema minus TaxID=303371 RepID=A0A835YRP7_9STRA|nr:Vasohibin-domain-containing protein [Tribonema minus]